MTGTASATLEQEILGELRRQGIVVWLDATSSYSGFVDRLIAGQAAGSFPFPVVGFRGSFLELLFELEPYGSGLEKQQLLIHMPGFTEETIRRTPVLELYEAGVRYRKRLDTLVREAATSRVAPAEVEAFVTKAFTLEEADAWLESAGQTSGGGAGLAATLARMGPALLAEALSNPDSALATYTSDADGAALREYLHKLTGMDAQWPALIRPEGAGLRDTLDALVAWGLCVEYVHDLKRPAELAPLRQLRELSAPLVKASTQLVSQLRRDKPDEYARLADEVEGIFAAELAAMAPEDLGHIDTFREEENRVLLGAVEALGRGDWSKAKAWCDARQGENSFWLQRDRTHRLAWTFIDEAAGFGQTLDRWKTPFAGVRSLEEAAEAYAAGPFEVDRAHRRFEQKRLDLLDATLPHHAELTEVTSALRRAHRDWADNLARAFAAICKDTGFLPPASHQQRTLFEQVVHPLTLSGELVAVFLIDAFRFEMATELLEDLRGPGTLVDLKPRLAELPTVTSVGMNVLAPVSSDGRLKVAGAFKGFKSGQFTVSTPDERVRAMGERSARKKAASRRLADVAAATPANLAKDLKQHSLIVVHSKEIDDAGEANMGLPTFDSTLRQIRAAWHHLQLAGVKHFVFTADHGFLIQDATTVARPFGEASRRHFLSADPRAEAGMVNVSVSDLGYDGITGYLLFRDDTAIFAKDNGGATFVHGGNSPQERIIPVLTVTTKVREVASAAEYAIEVKALDDVLKLHRWQVRLGFSKATTASLGFAVNPLVDVALHVPGREGTRVVVKEVTRPGVLKDGRLQLPIGSDWSEVFFTVEGPADARVRVEIHHPDKIEKVQSASPEQLYDVRVPPRAKASTAPPPPPPDTPLSWADTIADESVRKVFLHIEKHGAIAEAEIVLLLGSPRQFRRFSLEFETHLPKLPFRVRIEGAENGKRYVREGSR